MKILLTILFAASFLVAQNNVTLLSNLNQHPSAGYNDIWGYVDGAGNEYALLGVQTGTSIVNVTNPANPVQVTFIPGPSSTWRDIKTHSTYAYIVTEGTGTGRGLQIVDLSQLPGTATLVNTIETWFTRAHNIYIDNGYAYVIGTNNGGGMHILDLPNAELPGCIKTQKCIAALGEGNPGERLVGADGQQVALAGHVVEVGRARSAHAQQRFGPL